LSAEKNTARLIYEKQKIYKYRKIRNNLRRGVFCDVGRRFCARIDRVVEGHFGYIPVFPRIAYGIVGISFSQKLKQIDVCFPYRLRRTYCAFIAYRTNTRKIGVT
jgi:hypothetical protein